MSFFLPFSYSYMGEMFCNKNGIIDFYTSCTLNETKKTPYLALLVVTDGTDGDRRFQNVICTSWL